MLTLIITCAIHDLNCLKYINNPITSDTEAFLQFISFLFDMVILWGFIGLVYKNIWRK